MKITISAPNTKLMSFSEMIKHRREKFVVYDLALGFPTKTDRILHIDDNGKLICELDKTFSVVGTHCWDSYYWAFALISPGIERLKFDKLGSFEKHLFRVYETGKATNKYIYTNSGKYIYIDGLMMSEVSDNNCWNHHIWTFEDLGKVTLTIEE